MCISAYAISTPDFAVRSDRNMAVWFAVFTFAHVKDERTQNISTDGTSSSGPILSLIALMLMRSVCFPYKDLYYVLRMLKTLPNAIWYLCTCPIALWGSIPPNFRFTPTSLPMFLKCSDANRDSMSSLTIYRNPI